MTRIVLGRPRSLLRRALAWIRPPLPPPQWCARCGAIRTDDPNISRLYGSRSHIECSGFYNFAGPGEPEWVRCLSYRTYSQ